MSAGPFCLTDDELEDLTGSPLPAFQMKWLDAEGWIYKVNRRGRPRVSRAYAEQQMGVVAANDEPRSGRGSEPDWPIQQAG